MLCLIRVLSYSLWQRLDFDYKTDKAISFSLNH